MESKLGFKIPEMAFLENELRVEGVLRYSAKGALRACADKTSLQVSMADVVAHAGTGDREGKRGGPGVQRHFLPFLSEDSKLEPTDEKFRTRSSTNAEPILHAHALYAKSSMTMAFRAVHASE